MLYDDLDVNEHIEYIARLHGTEDWEEYGDDLLEMFNLTDRADDLPSRFSRGLKQKTGLILGLIRPFSLLLIDEPFVGLDTPGQETLVEVLADIAEQGAAVVCSTHQMDLTPKASLAASASATASWCTTGPPPPRRSAPSSRADDDVRHRVRAAHRTNALRQEL